MKATLDLYTDYLISSTGQTTATGLATLLDGQLSHDSVTRLLNTTQLTSKALWQEVKPFVRTHQSQQACLAFDDCIIEKQYTDENDLISWHWDHAKGRSVKGINLLTAFYITQQDEKSPLVCLPVSFELVLKTLVLCVVKTRKETRQSPVTKNEMMQAMISQCIHNQLVFKYILADSWYASSANMHFIASKNKCFIFDLKDNRLASFTPKQAGKRAEWTNINEMALPDNRPVQVWLKDVDFPVLLTKQLFKNEDDQTTGVRFLVTNELSLTNDDLLILYKKRWKIEEYHKSLKQHTSIAKSPTRTVLTQSNHLYCSLLAYVKLEQLKWSTRLSQSQLKAKLYLKALQASFEELTLIRASVHPA
jgi:hypothetical protein